MAITTAVASDNPHTCFTTVRIRSNCLAPTFWLTKEALAEARAMAPVSTTLNIFPAALMPAANTVPYWLIWDCTKVPPTAMTILWAIMGIHMPIYSFNSRPSGLRYFRLTWNTG